MVGRRNAAPSWILLFLSLLACLLLMLLLQLVEIDAYHPAASSSYPSHNSNSGRAHKMVGRAVTVAPSLRRTRTRQSLYSLVTAPLNMATWSGTFVGLWSWVCGFPQYSAQTSYACSVELTKIAIADSRAVQDYQAFLASGKQEIELKEDGPSVVVRTTAQPSTRGLASDLDLLPEVWNVLGGGQDVEVFPDATSLPTELGGRTEYPIYIALPPQLLESFLSNLNPCFVERIDDFVFFSGKLPFGNTEDVLKEKGAFALSGCVGVVCLVDLFRWRGVCAWKDQFFSSSRRTKLTLQFTTTPPFSVRQGIAATA